MALVALDFLVFADQLELRFFVFKADLVPTVCIVAVNAVCAELAAVLVLVTGDTILF